jgi:hypothetical protein
MGVVDGLWLVRGNLSSQVRHALLGDKPGREDRFGSVAVMALAFVIMENPKAAHEVQQLIVFETEFSPAWMLVTEMIVDEKGFID